MTAPVLLQACPLIPLLERQLAQTYEMHRLPSGSHEPQAFIAANGYRFDGLVTSAGYGVDSALLDALPRLRIISSFGVGLDKVDVAAASRRGIPVGYTPDVLTDCVADLAFGLLMAVSRRIPEGDRFVRQGLWSAQPVAPFPLGQRVSHARLGIIGLGRIGRAVAERAAGFSMEIRYCNPFAIADVPWLHEPSLIELAQWCDFLVVCTAGGPHTRHLVGADVLDALSAKGFLVNVSRGSVVDEQALVQALQQGRIAGAALDVYEREPHVPSELAALDNVVMLPHIASSTVQTREGMAQRVLDNLAAFFAGQPLPSAAPPA
jgi:hydroxypyruvate reductase